MASHCPKKQHWYKKWRKSFKFLKKNGLKLRILSIPEFSIKCEDRIGIFKHWRSQSLPLSHAYFLGNCWRMCSNKISKPKKMTVENSGNKENNPGRESPGWWWRKIWDNSWAAGLDDYSPDQRRSLEGSRKNFSKMMKLIDCLMCMNVLEGDLHF